MFEIFCEVTHVVFFFAGPKLFELRHEELLQLEPASFVQAKVWRKLLPNTLKI